MARPLRIQRPDLTYHVTARGNARGRIFVDDVDRCRFLEILAETAASHALMIHSYCQMENHYHLVFTTTRANLSTALRRQNGVYAQWWNRRHKRCGHVFQSRFFAQVVERDEYLLEACRYVVLNPVRANIVLRPEQWPWSNYRATIGLAPHPSFLNDGDLLAKFGSVGGEEVDSTRRAFRSFVEAALLPASRSQSQSLLRRGPVVGSRRYATLLLRGDDHSTEIPSKECRQARPTLTALFRGAVRLRQRREAMATAYIAHEYSMRQIAGFLGLHYTTVSRAIREVRQVPDRAKTDK